MEWFRMYYEARSDKKLDILPDDQHRVWFNLICYAAEHGGVTPVTDHYLLAVETAKGNVDLLEATINSLKILKMVTQEETGYRFVNFAKRQYKKPSDQPSRVSERVKKSRSSKKKAACNAPVTPCNAPVTTKNTPETETETETDIVVVTHAREDQVVADVFNFVQNKIGIVTVDTRDRLLDLIDHFPRDWIFKAMEMAVDKKEARNKPNFASGILLNWREDGFEDWQKPWESDKRGSNRPRDRGSGGKSKVGAKPSETDWEAERHSVL